MKAMKELSGVIFTQEDLDKVIREERGMYYISLNGMVAMFGNNIKLNLIRANEKLEQMAAGSSEAIANAIAMGNKKEAKEFLDVLVQTYLIPFRIH